MLGGSVAGGSSPSRPALGCRSPAADLGVMFVVAFRLMHDIGFSPDRGGRPLGEMRKAATASIEYGWQRAGGQAADDRGAVRWWRRHLRLLRLQPYLLDFHGDPQAYQVAGLVAAIVAGVQILGGGCTLYPPAVSPPYVGADHYRRGERGHARSDR